MKVTTKDFQILKGTNTFEFPEGITIIQGKNGSGKSTLFYAIEDCLTNPSGVADTINWDADECSVTIENNGACVTWKKTPSSSTYIDGLSGQEFVKASKLDSRDIGDLGFYFDNRNNVVNIHNEWSTLFPFGASDTDMFRLFEDIFNISSSFAIIDEIKKDEQSKKSEITQTTNEINKLNLQLQRIAQKLVAIDEEKLEHNINQLIKTKQEMSSLVDDYNNLSKNYGLKKSVVPQGFDISNLMEADSQYKELQKIYNDYLSYKEMVNIDIPELKTFELESPAICADYTDYLTTQNILAQYNRDLENLQIEENKVKEKLKQIKVCPTCGHPLEG